MELDLHPKSLGRIEIQLEMKNGELEAYFNASKAITLTYKTECQD